MRNSEMRVVTRLGMGFGLVAVLLATVTMFGIQRMGRMQERVDEIVDVNSVESKLVAKMDLTVTERALALRNLILLPEDRQEEIQIELKRIAAQSDKYDEAQNKLGEMFSTDSVTSPEETALYGQIRQQALLAAPFLAKAKELIQEKKNSEAYQLLRFEFRPVQKKWWELLRELAVIEEKQNAEGAAAIQQAYQETRSLMLVLGALALLCSVVAAVMITRSLLRQLGGEPAYAANIAARIAAGDLSVVIDTAPQDRSSLVFAMKTMRDSLAGIVGQVLDRSGAIESASVQIAAGNLDLSSRTEQQAASLEETASSMDELASTVKQNADSARLANELAVSASAIALKGGSVVAEVVGTMGSINESAGKIGNIIGVIDGIAFQTNILALNAAVEAARAGEQGRGFAVVATEVRNLAQRSAAAAQEIKVLIGDSMEKVEMGSKLVDQAGATMGEIVGSIQRVTDIMGGITTATQEQSAGIDQVSQAITQMDQVTQQNAALVEEASAAAASLQDQAAGLVRMVGVFKLADGHAGRAAPAAVVLPLVRKAPPRPMAKLTAPARPARGRAAAGAEEWEEF
ncbi:MCP four helix bundle domain-containing protein [Duganella sp. HSC-15S17]|uniref:MCP four helix bundle domain-containing protein n=3 Tax=Duganella violaceipulchra TaxID=2849652 RepID=A0AA41L3L4_9BURK|nr:methyl-accepting chemotaxis protein [Duganella violaceicalia]MBV6319887.1 MCP four helix bundle domain-containing protein [Duganella violaceicalia]